MVNLTTRPISGSNFTIFDNSDGDFGIQYKVGEGSPVEKVTVEIAADPLSKIVQEVINNSKPNANISKAIIKSILSRIGNAYPSLYNLTKNSTILNRLLHKNVIFVDGFNNATIVYADGTTQDVDKEAYAAYIPGDVTLKIGDKSIKVEQGQIVVGTKFMELLDGNVADISDALHHLLHENVHGFIADNDKANPELNARYKKELNDLWDEFTRKHPASPHAKREGYNDLEEFIVESLTNADLMKELNDTIADEPLSNPKQPKSLLGKLFDKLLSWLADVLKGPNGEKFELNKDSLFAKEYAIFEETIMTTTKEQVENKVKAKRVTKPEPKPADAQYVEGTLNFEQDEPVEIPTDDGVVGFEPKVPTDSSQIPSTGEVTIGTDNRTKAPRRRRNVKSSTVPMTFPSLRGGIDNVSADTYFDIQEKINNGVLSIKCS